MSSELRIPLTQRRTGSSALKACFNATNAFLGIGLLTVPYALSSGGWFSLIFFFAIAVMTFYTGILLKRCMETDPSIKTYLDIAEHAYGKMGKVIVSLSMNSELYLVATGLMILEGDNLDNLFPNFAIKLGDWEIGGKESFIIITALIIFPSLLLMDLSILSYVSATGVFSCLIILGSIFCLGAFEGVGFDAKGDLLDVGGIPTAVSLYVVCFAGHPVIPTIYDSMQHPDQFNMVMFFSSLITTITYGSTAIISYLMFGKYVESQITLSLPTSKVSAQVAIYTTLLIPLTRYALIITPLANSIEGGLSENYKNRRPVKMSIRIALLISTVVVASVFPYYESLMAIIGSIFVVLASFLFPCFCYLKLSGSYRSWNCETIGIWVIVIFGILAGTIGTYSSIVDLVNSI